MKEKILTNKLLILFFVVLIGLVMWQFVVEKDNLFLEKESFQLQDHQLISTQLGSKKLTLEVVNTPSSITQGLSDRESIGSDGMLFIFPQAKKQTFWMRQMKFSLDMIWINHGQVIDISHDVPAPESTTPDWQLSTYSPKSEADMVLEVLANKAREWDINIGDKLQFVSN